MLAVGAVGLAACGSNNNTTAPAGSGSASGSGSGSATAADAGITCATGSLQLAGSTAQSNAMSVWIKNYQTACPGATINYGGGGSGKGVQNFQDGTIDFAGSDFSLTPADTPKADARCKAGPAINLPMVPGPIAVGFNLPGVTTLNLSAAVQAKIFGGQITNWNDPAIKADNPGANLPSATITTFHRSDASGTSYNYSNYLTNVAGSAWSYGANKTWPAPGGQGQNGTAGIAQGVKSTPGGIGYMELSFATQNNITYAKVGNEQGKFINLTTSNVVNFLSKASITGSGNNLPLKFDYATKDLNAYPNLLVTYEIACSAGNDPAKLPLIKGFLGYLASNAGQALLPTEGYVKLPTDIQSKVQKAVAGMS